MTNRGIRTLFLVVFLLLAGACSSGGSGGSGPTVQPPPPPPPPPPSSSIDLTSDAGDFIGGGSAYSYTKADAEITVTVANAHLTIRVNGDETWSGDFVLPDTYTQLEAGTYNNLSRFPFHDTSVGGLSWSGEGRGCNTLTGEIVINSVVYDGTTLVEIDLEFTQYCEGGVPALHGDIYWDANDTTGPPGPVVPPPANLWEPSAGATPATGNYIYLESDPGDYIGQGGTYLYTSANSVLTSSMANGRLSVTVNGNERWFGDFQAMSTLSQLEAGYYGGLQRFPFHNPVKGALSWSGDGRGCNTLTGWFVVDSVTYDGMTLDSIDLRFGQHCEGGAPALYGEIHWDANDTTGAAGPVVPPPAGLWEPASGITPATGNYIYLESELGDFIGAGGNYLYTLRDSEIIATTTDGHLSISVNGDEGWGGDFQAMNSLSRLEVGYYGDLQRYPFHNPTMGGLNWSGEGRGCNTLTGWFVVDSVTYDGMTLDSIDLRFGQHCEGGSPALHGEIHWDADDPTTAPGPVVPPPTGLWAPPSGATPATGNYVYLQSYVGAADTYLYTQADSVIRVNSFDARVTVSIFGDEDWNGTFEAMNSLSRLEVGYYGDLQRFPFHNPVKGGLSWAGGCNTLEGWVVIDSLTYDGAELVAIDMRFEERCEGGSVSMHGEIHWDASDTTSAPGPVVPLPTGLWEPDAGTTPDTGNYVYLESETGDYIGQGGTYTYTPAETQMSVSSTGALFSVSINDSEWWNGDFQGMNFLSRLEVGYYGDLQRYPFQNPVKGGLSWYGQGRGCNQLVGWFVVDSVTYDGVDLTAIDLRFEQHCEGRTAALNGEIHWTL